MAKTVKLRTVLVVVAVLASCSIANSQDLRDAVRLGNVERVKELLESGADANTSYENRFTPIYFASDPKVVDLLLAHGAKLDIRDAALIQTPIENAAASFFRAKNKRDNWKIIVAKLRKAGADYTIDTATYMNDIAFVKQQLLKDASWVNKTRGAQLVPLRLAARTGRVEICKLLLKHKADPNSFEEGSGYPIMVDAVRHSEVVRLLIENGANLKRRITWLGGRTGIWIIGDEGSALHYAVSAGNLRSVKLLIDAGLDPNATDNEGQTPLHIAIRFERWEANGNRDTSPFQKIVECLLENDASLRFTDKSGKTPLELAKKLKSPKNIQHALRNKQKELDAAYRRAIFDNR